MTRSAAEKLRALLDAPGLCLMPCCFDALSARLIEDAGFELTFMSGFGVSAARCALPDTGLLSYGEMVAQGRSITEAVSIPVIGDADTGYGNPLNVKRTVAGYARAGFACAMIEDQVAPKRCGHTRGKAVVPRAEALARMRAAVDARNESRALGHDLLLMARTDARASSGMDEALARGAAFAEIGADIVFVEAPMDASELARIPREIGVPTMANLLEDGDTPWLSPAELQDLGFRIAAYPLTLLHASIFAMQEALRRLRAGQPLERRMDFRSLRELLGFDAYDAELARYR